MKLALSTDFGSRHHWEQLVAFAQKHSVERLVFWGDYSTAGFAPPFLFPRHPEWLTGDERARREKIRERMADAGRRTREAGLEFWYCFQVLMVPDIGRVKAFNPELFNAEGEPDMSSPAVYSLLEEQIDELLEIAPNLGGFEMWIMECANIVVSNLAHQRIPLDEICARIVATVHAKCRRHNLALALCLHTAGGHRAMLEGLLKAASSFPDITVTADDVIGDFQLHLPFNQHLWRAARTNPVQVCFDLNGEYWGRNFYPTCALRQYAEHIEETRRLGATWINGRISTGHDKWSPHFNVLPSRRGFYPAADRVVAGKPLPVDLEVCCFDTLGGFNAEYFCKNVVESGADSCAIVRNFLSTEFGQAPDDFVSALVDVEGVAARVFFAGQNYFNSQTVLPSPSLARFWALDLQLTAPAGEIFVRHDTPPGGRAAFSGWPVVQGLRTTGAQALIQEKRQALTDAEALLARVKRATAQFDPVARDFIISHFNDFALFTRAALALIEVMAHWFHLQADTCSGDIPDRKRLEALAEETLKIKQAWLERQPHDEWKVAARLSEWHALISSA